MVRIELRNPLKVIRNENFELPSPSGGRIRVKDSDAENISILDSNRRDPVLLENMYANEPILQSGILTWQIGRASCRERV